ncbi:MAG: tRNA lysidine(34) synthetase TilS [Cyclobacteriaceae bacterium]|nr:tRNA lysidine(34) synthetase TilS [Cyclobacteriaceae bacterium]
MIRYRLIFDSKIGKSYLWPVLDKLKHYIEEKNLINQHDRLLIAVSGGLDSMVLLQMLHRSGYEVAVAHCNFQLRGNDSDQDEEFVRQHCVRLNIPFFSKRFDTNNYASEHKLSIQMAARQLRYHWFSTLMSEKGYAKLATAHHFNDSVETVLLNWIRGGGIDLLKGILPIRENIIRPLLFATREELNHYAAENEITWREDISNQTDDYQRNLIRHQVIPQLKRINSSLENTLLESTRKIEGEIRFLENCLEAWKAQHIESENTITRISKSALSEPAYGASLLWRIIRDVGFAFHMCEEIIATLPGQPGKQFYNDTHRLVVDREYLLITKRIQVWNDNRIEENQSEVRMGDWHLKIDRDAALKPSELLNVAVLDSDKIQFPLQWRKWKIGDSFYPLGMNQRKKLSDFLIDNKVSMVEKDAVTVLECGGEILWVAGYRIDNRFKLTKDTKRAISFTLQPYLS